MPGPALLRARGGLPLLWALRSERKESDQLSMHTCIWWVGICRFGALTSSIRDLRHSRQLLHSGTTGSELTHKLAV